MSTKSKFLLILLLLLSALAVRLWRFDQPVATWHSHRQVDTLSVTRNLIASRFQNIFLPTYHDLSNVQSGLDNPRGLRLVEFPLYNLLSAAVSATTHLSVESSSRLVSIASHLLGSIFLFSIVTIITKSYPAAFFSVFVYLFLPFGIYFSRSIFPENLGNFLFLFALWALLSRRTFVLLVTLSLALLIKPYYLFLFTPLVLLSKSKIKSLVFIALSAIPLFLWRQQFSAFPEGIPFNRWLLIFDQKYLAPNNFSPNPPIPFLSALIPFKPYWFRWLFAERVGRLILGIFLTPLLVLPALTDRYRRHFYLLSLGILAYFVIVAGGNIRHDYYQILILPSLTLILSLAIAGSIKFSLHNFLFVTILIFLSFFYSWYQVKDYYQINHPETISLGQKADSLIPTDAIVIAPYNGDTTLLYQTNRSGYPTEIYQFDHIKALYPADQTFYLVSVNFDDYTNNLISRHPALYRDQDGVILDLNISSQNEN